MPLHVGRGSTIASTLAGSLDYVEDPGKTQDSEFISSYECDAKTADAEFLLSKSLYKNLTGRDQGDNNVIAYHVRQSFRPGEITPEEANRIGYELAMRFTKGKHAFVVCTHVDRHHIHSHIIWNSTTLDCRGKFRNFIGSPHIKADFSREILMSFNNELLFLPLSSGACPRLNGKFFYK